MAIPWRVIDRVETADGELQLRQRGELDFLITLQGRVLMNSQANRSEQVLAELVCEALTEQASPQLLLGGLGMGCTLHTALSRVPEQTRITVSELTPRVEQWCREPLAALNGNALQDPRVSVLIEDVARTISRRAEDRQHPRFDAIILDLYEGPHANTHPKRDPIYGLQALDTTRRALALGGVFAIWSEVPDSGFEARLQKVGYRVERRRAGQGGRRHAIYIARRKR